MCSAEHRLAERRALVERRLEWLGTYLADTADPPGTGTETADQPGPDNPA
jgi:hypothetical protein